MKILLLTVFGYLLPGVVNAFGDVVTIKDGTVMSGQVESGSAREIRVKVDGEIRAVPVERIQSIQFDSPAAPAARPSRAALPCRPERRSPFARWIESLPKRPA